jgi:cytochrome c oxidase subunit 2
MKAPVRILLLPLAAVALGGSGWQSALEAHGPQAERIADLFWLFVYVCSAIWGLVVLVLCIGLLLRRRAAVPASPLALDPATERRTTGIVTALVAVTALIVFILTGLSYVTGKRLASLAQDTPMTLQVTGHQWWWEITYQDPSPERVLRTANEIHIPTGRPVRLVLNSTDVIHSMWVPNLFGKRDLLPGLQAVIDFQADKPGVYRGQCAEFCGLQHARMGFLVVAEPPEAFDAWRLAQLRAAEAPKEPERQRGEQVFLRSACIMCHQVRGTPSAGRVGPELTHLASRQFIAAGTLPMNRGNLAGWITDPQGIKPGANMPMTQIPPQDLHDLVSYLEGLR